MDPPLTPDLKGKASMIDHLTGRTHEMKQKLREELLSTQLGDLKGYAPLFEKIRDEGHVCALGNEDKLKKSKSTFSQLVKVFH